MAIEDHEYWKGKPLNYAKIQVFDIGQEVRSFGAASRLGLTELLTADLPRQSAGRDVDCPVRYGRNLSKALQGVGATRTEEQRVTIFESQYNWLRSLRISGDDPAKQVRWIHVSSKLPENLQGCFVGFTDWSKDISASLATYRHLFRATLENERFSKHGKYYIPFVRPLNGKGAADDPAVLISTPFLDWTVNGPTPPLRFQVDERERFASYRSAAHPLRSLLQYYYRFEDTHDRDKAQVFSKHQPWLTDREVDLKVRRWYGHYPTGLNVDELWILCIDKRHVITFSSNQSWKSAFPPLQLSARIAQVAFRRVREPYLETCNGAACEYSAYAHAIACLHGAIDIVQRNTGADIPLSVQGRYGGYLSHLQYRLYRSPTTQLVMDLLQTLDELNIVLNVTKSQQAVVRALERFIERYQLDVDARPHRPQIYNVRGDFELQDPTEVEESQESFQIPDASSPSVIAELDTRLSHEIDDFNELHINCNGLITRTVQLVNIRVEGHGRAVLAFTIVTVIFLPLSFFASYFGMNLEDIRNSEWDQNKWWLWGSILTLLVILMSSTLAFYGDTMKESLVIWLEQRRRHAATSHEKVALRERIMQRSERVDSSRLSTSNLRFLSSKPG